MLFFSVDPFAECSSILLFVSKSHFLQQWRTGRSQGEMRWRQGWPQIQSLTETKKSSNTRSASGLQQGDTNPHSPGFRYFSQRPGSSRLLICLCFLSLVLSISVVAMEVCPVYLVDFTLSSGSQKFALKHCCESFNLKAYDCFALKRLSRKKDDCSVQSCSSTKHIAQRTE